jgi:hypothetical protein
MGDFFFPMSPVRSEGFDAFPRVMEDTCNPAMPLDALGKHAGEVWGRSEISASREGGSLRRAQGAPFP